MKRLRKILGLCNHKRKTIERHNLESNGILCGAAFILRCEKCGNMKVVKTK